MHQLLGTRLLRLLDLIQTVAVLLELSVGVTLTFELLATCSRALEQLAQPFDALAVIGGVALLEKAVHRRLEVTVLHHVIGQQFQELVDVDVTVVVLGEATKAVTDRH